MSTKSFINIINNRKGLIDKIDYYGDLALKDCMEEFKDILSFSNVYTGFKYKRSLQSERDSTERRNRFHSNLINSSLKIQTANLFTELFLFKDSSIDINTSNRNIVNDIAKFFSNEFIHKFYENLKNRVLNAMSLNSESYSIEIMKAIPNNLYYEFEPINHFYFSNFITRGSFSSTVENLSHNLMMPFISFVNDNDYECKECITFLPYSQEYYTYTRNRMANYSIEESRYNEKIDSLFKSSDDIFKSGTLVNMNIVIGNLYNYLLLKIEDKNTKEDCFIYFNKFGASPRILKNPTSIPYIVSALKRDKTINTNISLDSVYNEYLAKKGQLEIHISMYIKYIIDDILRDSEYEFRNDNPLNLVIKSTDYFLGSFLVPKYELKDGYIKLSNPTNTNVYPIKVSYCDVPELPEYRKQIKINYDDLVSDSDEYSKVVISGEYYYTPKITNEIIDKYILKPLKSKRDLFRRIDYIDNQQIESLVEDIKDLKSKLEAIQKSSKKDRDELLKNVSFVGKEVNIQNKFTEIEYYGNSSDYRINCISLD